MIASSTSITPGIDVETAEQRITAAMIARPDCAHLAAQIDPSMFASTNLGLVVDICQQMLSESNEVDTIELTRRLQAAGLSTGELRDITEIVDQYMDLARPAWVARDIALLHEQRRARQLADLGTRLHERCGAGMNADEAVELIQARLSQLARSQPVEDVNLAALLNDDPADDPHDVRATGLEFLDRSIGGLASGDAIVLSGEPGGGKTSFASQIAIALMDSHDDLHAIVALTEETPKQWRNRVLSQVSGLALGLLRRPWDQLSPSQATAKRDGIASLRVIGGRIHFITAPTPAMIESKLAAIDGPCHILIDYIQTLRPSREAANRRDGIDACVADLIRIGQQYDCSQVWVSNLAKPQHGGRRTILTAAKESSEISYAADLFFIAERVSADGRVLEHPDDDPTHRVRWSCLKNRRGKPTDIYTVFDGDSMTFSTADGGTAW